MRAALSALALLATTGSAVADHRSVASEDEGNADQVVLLNATTNLGDLGQLSRLRRALDQRGLLLRLPESLEATLDQRNLVIGDLDQIRDAYANLDFDTVLKLVQADETRILENAAAGDPLPALAELAQWRGIAAAALNQSDEALKWFRGAYRFNPAWSIDKKLESPKIRAIAKKARLETPDVGTLVVDADPARSTISIDGGEQRPSHDKLELPVGVHVVVVTAPSRTAYAELVEIQQGAPFKVTIALDKESKLDRAARLVDATVAAPPGKQRLERAKALSHLTGVSRLLVVEGGAQDHITVRVYDVPANRLSGAIDLQGAATSAEIARQIKAALDPDRVLDVTSVRQPGGEPEQQWYQRWYVWAGIAAVAGASFGGYEYMTRGPATVRGF